MAGQSDATDDLIAELAKLMAQDAQGERPAQPAVPAFPVRISGSEPDKMVLPAHNFDLVRSTTAPSSPVPQPVAAPLAPTQPEASLAADDLPEAIHFDFGLTAPMREAEQLAVPAAAAPFEACGHDGIADLIAAGLSAEPEPLPALSPFSVPVAPLDPNSAPVRLPGWAPTNVATNLGDSEQQPRPALRTVNFQPEPRSEQDRFKVPPVFGLGTMPAPSASPADTAPMPQLDIGLAPAPVEQPRPAASIPLYSTTPKSIIAPVEPEESADDEFDLDPIDEIESLIGRAMRMEFNNPAAEEKPAPSPALRSLATPTLPTPASAADETIFAAAQASGAQVGWVEAPEVSEPDPSAYKQRRAPRDRAPLSFGMTRALAGPLVAVTLLLAAGLGLYWVLGLGREHGPAPLLTADATPVKETPAAQLDAGAAQQSIVFNEMDGVVPGVEEQLVSRDQTDVNEVTQLAAPPGLSQEGLANRKVRTVTVRPDGTIVAGDESVAGNAILPVDRPNVPFVPGAEAAPDLIASAQPEPVAPVATAPVQPGSTVPVVDVSGSPIAGRTAVVPRLRPAAFAQAASALPAAPVGAVIATPVVAAAVSGEIGQLASAPTATEVAPLNNDAPAYVQLASQRSEDDARATASAMVTRFGPLFGGANMEVQRVDLGPKGIYYRVRVPAASMEQAKFMCTNVQAAGGDCFTM